MTTKITGKDCIIVLGAVTVAATDVISIVTRFAGKKTDSTGMGDDWDTFLSDLSKGAEFTINGYNTGTQAAEANSLRKGVEDIWSQDDHSDTFEIRQSGTGVGLRKISGTFILDDWEQSDEKAQTSTLNANFSTTGTVTIGTQS